MKRREVYYGVMNKILSKVIEFNRKHKSDGIRVELNVSNVDTHTTLTLFYRNDLGLTQCIFAYLYDDDFFKIASDLEKWAKEKIPA